MRRCLFALVLSLLSTIVFGQSNIVVLGDSLSAGYGIDIGQGWISLIQRRLQTAAPGYTIINESISGDTSAGGLARLEPILTKYQPKVILLELGANDGLRGLPLSQLKDNLGQIIHQVQITGAKVLLLGMRIPPNYGRRFVDGFYRVYPQLAQELNVPYVPFIMEDIALVKDLMQPDGLHPNAKAQPLIADKVWRHLHLLIQLKK